MVIRTQSGELVDRLSPWAPYVVQPPKEQGYVFKQITWNPPTKYQFKHPKVKRPESLRIYECHVGIATPEPKVGTYKEFAKNVIPRITKQGLLFEKNICLINLMTIIKR